MQRKRTEWGSSSNNLPTERLSAGLTGEGPSPVARRSTSGAGESARSCPRLAPAPLAALPLRQLTAPAPVWQEICVPDAPHVGLAWSQRDLHDGRLMAF